MTDKPYRRLLLWTRRPGLFQGFLVVREEAGETPEFAELAGATVLRYVFKAAYAEDITDRYRNRDGVLRLEVSEPRSKRD